jgi:hypothetical protein
MIERESMSLTKVVSKTHLGGTLVEYFDANGNRVRAVHTTGKLSAVSDEFTSPVKSRQGG